MFIIVLGQHVSILIELSSGPSLSVKRESKQSNKKKTSEAKPVQRGYNKQQPTVAYNNEQESLLTYNVTKTTQSAYMNDKLHKSNKPREINDVNTPSLSLQKCNHSTLEIRA